MGQRIKLVEYLLGFLILGAIQILIYHQDLVKTTIKADRFHFDQRVVSVRAVLYQITGLTFHLYW